MTLRLPLRTKALDEVSSPERGVLKGINQPGLMFDDNRGVVTADKDVTQGFPAWCVFPTPLDDWMQCHEKSGRPMQAFAAIACRRHDRQRSASAQWAAGPVDAEAWRYDEVMTIVA